MASTVLVKDVLRRVAENCNDFDPQFHHWTETEYVQALNEAQNILAKYLPPSCTRVDAVKLASGTRQTIDSIAAANVKPSVGSAPASSLIGFQLIDVVRNMGSNGLTPGAAIIGVSRDLLDTMSPLWHQSTGSEIECFVYDPQVPKTFYVYPGVNPSATVWAELHWIAMPPAIPLPPEGTSLYGYLSTDHTTLSVSDEYADEVLNYCIARLNLKDSDAADADRANTFGSLFTGALNAKVQALTGANPNLKRLPMAPEPLARAS